MQDLPLEDTADGSIGIDLIRRDFLLSLGAVAGVGGIVWPQSAAAATQDFLSAFADTILPDGDLPGALPLGSLSRVLDRAEADAGFATILENAARSVDAGMMRQVGTRFADASPDHRQQVVSALERLPQTDLLGWFFVAVRAELFFHYYAQAGTERTVGLQGPPQPTGFDNIDQPWVPAS